MKFHAAIASVLATSTLTAGALALEWHDGPAGVVFQGAPRDAAQAFVVAQRAELRLTGVELAPTTVLPGRSGATVRFAQTHRGLPVFDAAAAVRLGPGGDVARATLDVARGLDVDPTPGISEAVARKIVASLRGAGFDGTMAISLGVRFAGLAAPALVYRADVASPDGGVRYDIDAKTGRVLDSRSLGKTVTGTVYPISSVKTPTPMDAPLIDLDAPADRLNAFSGALSTFEYVSGAAGMNLVVAQDTAPDALGNFTFPVPTDLLDLHDPFAVVNTYFHTHRMRTFFEGTLGVDMSAASWSLGAVANVVNADGSKLDNAAFSPTPLGAPWNKANTIIIGQGTMSDFAYDSDVFLHEFTHYVAHNAIGYSNGQLGVDSYGLNTFPGSIDEGTADYFACTVNGDPVLGEASLGPLGATRDLSKNLVTCPQDLYGEVHADGEIIGSITWAVHEALGNTRADPLVWSAMTMLTMSSSLGDLATAILAEANDMQMHGDITPVELAAIQKAVTDRGLDDCGRVLALDQKSRTMKLIGLDTIAQAFGADCATVQGFGIALNSLFHVSKKPAKGAHGVTFHASLESQGSGALKWAIYARPGDHVTFQGGTGPVPIPTVAQFTHKLDGLTATSGDLTIDENSNPPFDPNQTYYAVVVQANCPNTTLTFSAEDATGPVGTGGAGPSSTSGAGGGGGNGANESDSGCGCKTPEGGAPSSSAAIGLLVAAAAMARRRRAKPRG